MIASKAIDLKTLTITLMIIILKNTRKSYSLCNTLKIAKTLKKLGIKQIINGVKEKIAKDMFFEI